MVIRVSHEGDVLSRKRIRIPGLSIRCPFILTVMQSSDHLDEDVGSPEAEEGAVMTAFAMPSLPGSHQTISFCPDFLRASYKASFAFATGKLNLKNLVVTACTAGVIRGRFVLFRLVYD